MLVIPLLLLQLAHAGTAKDPGKKHISPTAVLRPTQKSAAHAQHRKNCLMLDINVKNWCTPEEAKYHPCMPLEVAQACPDEHLHDGVCLKRKTPAELASSAIVGWIIIAATGFVLYKSTGPHEPLF